RPLVSTPDGAIGTSFASFTVAQPPFDDEAVRRAVAYAMDRAAFTDGVNPGFFPKLAEHFTPDTFEASLLASWSGLPGGGRGDLAAAREAMTDSRYATGSRCDDPACDGVQIVV